MTPWFELVLGVLVFGAVASLRCFIFSERARYQGRAFSTRRTSLAFLRFLCSLALPGLGQALGGRYHMGILHLVIFAVIAASFGTISVGVGILSAVHTLLK